MTFTKPEDVEYPDWLRNLMSYVLDETRTRYHHDGLEFAMAMTESRPLIRPGTMVFVGPSKGTYPSRSRGDIWSDWVSCVKENSITGTIWKKPDDRAGMDMSFCPSIPRHLDLVPPSDTKTMPYYFYPLPNELGDTPGSLHFTYLRRVSEMLQDPSMMRLDKEGCMVPLVLIPGMEPCDFQGTRIWGPMLPSEGKITTTKGFFEWLQTQRKRVNAFGNVYEVYTG